MCRLTRVLPVLMISSALLLLTGLGLRAADQPDGAAIFKQKCSMCHGQEGKGFAAIHTPDFTDPKVQASLSDQQIADAIKNGKPNTAMKAFGDQLKEDEIQALVKQIRSFNTEKAGSKKGK